MTDKQFDNAYTAAGAWFVGIYAHDVLKNINELNNDKVFKKQFIKAIYNVNNIQKKGNKCHKQLLRM